MVLELQISRAPPSAASTAQAVLTEAASLAHAPLWAAARHAFQSTVEAFSHALLSQASYVQSWSFSVRPARTRFSTGPAA